MMNAKKIKLHDYHRYGSPLCDPQLFPATAAAGGLSFHPGPGLVGSLPQPHAGGWVHEEHTTTTPRSVLATQGQGGRCVGSDAAAFFAAEELMMGMARFDCPLGGTTTLPELTAFAKRPQFARPTTEAEQLYHRRPVDQLPLRDSSAVRTYYVRPQQRDGATEAPPSLELLFQRRQQQQQQERVHGLFGNASTGRLLGGTGGEPKAHSFPAHVAASTLLPAMEAPAGMQQSPMENPLSRSCSIGAPATHVGSVNVAAAPGQGAPSKTRIRWTQDLHERFVDCVNQLGGADKPTPKGILKLMNSDGLTIYHIKSHLQKCRIAKYMPASSTSEGKQEKRAAGNDVQNLDPSTGMKITEALRVQLDVQRRLHEQLEIQRNLQLRIEEQGKKLQKMFEEQMKASRTVMEPPQGTATAFLGVGEREEEEEDAFDNVQVQLLAAVASSDAGFQSKIS
ncbi:unnamed protein product [Miscanthus lutarioriparius]|uniref:HTH myb-type domain-containing protein n=1 Tax=Miscanthus lutarioriparius TaxID=422564 RepID=A0A811QQJ4_9POAL|nr:unnamed protein product [Miscanthus lutarioriparius]